MNIPQFGEPRPGATYPDRPAAFAIVERDGRIAVVRVEEGGRAGDLDLPGGGVDAGETEAEAAVRECGEEAGLKVAVESEPFTRADHYFISGEGALRNTRGAFVLGRVLGEDESLKIESDTLLWMTPQQALAELSRESHAWAVAVWIRRLHPAA